MDTTTVGSVTFTSDAYYDFVKWFTEHNYVLNEDEMENLYHYFIDCTYGEIDIGVKLMAAYVLEKCDPIAYRCGLQDYIDSSAYNEYRIEDKLWYTKIDIEELLEEFCDLSCRVCDFCGKYDLIHNCRFIEETMETACCECLSAEEQVS